MRSYITALITAMSIAHSGATNSALAEGCPKEVLGSNLNTETIAACIREMQAIQQRFEVLECISTALYLLPIKARELSIAQDEMKNNNAAQIKLSDDIENSGLTDSKIEQLAELMSTSSVILERIRNISNSIELNNTILEERKCPSKS